MNIAEYKIRIVVYGSRSFNNYEYFCSVIEAYLKQFKDEKDICFITGSAYYGPDRMIIDWCETNHYPYFECPAQWDEFGKRAGMIRNKIMAKKCTHSLGMWDGVSSGTKHMMQECFNNVENKSIVLLVDKHILKE